MEKKEEKIENKIEDIEANCTITLPYETYKYLLNNMKEGASKSYTKDTIIKEGRMVGNTTRLVDYYIQELFKGGEVRIHDHYGSKQADRDLISRIRQRLTIEHGIYCGGEVRLPDDTPIIILEVSNRNNTLRLYRDKVKNLKK